MTGTGTSSDNVLADVVWHALTGPQAHLARSGPGGRARAYVDGIAPFVGVGVLDADGWASLATLVGPRGTAVFLRGHVEPVGDGWRELLREPATQYVAGALPDPGARAAELVELGPADVPEMVALAAATEPGPFGPEGHRTGRWFGVRRGDRLVAMAGERMRPPGFGEVSGVCVAPEARGEGLGALVTLAAGRAVEERGDRAVLHVREGNEGAHRLYRRLGFEVARRVEVVVARRTT